VADNRFRPDGEDLTFPRLSCRASGRSSLIKRRRRKAKREGRRGNYYSRFPFFCGSRVSGARLLCEIAGETGASWGPIIPAGLSVPLKQQVSPLTSHVRVDPFSCFCVIGPLSERLKNSQRVRALTTEEYLISLPPPLPLQRTFPSSVRGIRTRKKRHKRK